MTDYKTVIYPKFISFTCISYVWLGVTFLVSSILVPVKIFNYSKKLPSFSDLTSIIFWLIILFCFIMGFFFVLSPFGKKITIDKNVVEYQNYFFIISKIRIDSETKIQMGMCYPKFGTHPEAIWKISNNHGKEKIKIHSDFFDYKKVNSEFEKLRWQKVELSHALIKF